MFSSESWLSNQQAGFYNGVATQSLRFDDGSSTYLSRTPSSAGNKKTFTFSTWIKRTEDSTNKTVFDATDSTYQRTAVIFEDKLVFYNQASPNISIQFDPKLRDPSSWYHIVVAVDTTDATSSNRVKGYVNGTQLTTSSTMPSQNQEFGINGTGQHMLGAIPYAFPYERLNGYLSETNLIDGLQLDPTYFGETKNGVWIAKEYTGSYGTNGFRLEYKNTSVGTGSSSTIGADTSGNGHHYTSGGIVASDCNMPDSPENNFATLNPLARRRDVTTLPTFSDGNLKAIYPDVGGNVTYGIGTIPTVSGKFYYEVYITNSAFGNIIVGIGTENDYAESGVNTSINYYRGGGIYKDGSLITTGASYTTGDIISCAYDLDNNTVSFYKNNSLQHTVTGVTSRLYVPFTRGKNSDTLSFNFGQDSSFAGNKTAQGNTDAKGIGDFYYAPPSGFLALCTSNLPEPTISPNSATQADDYFNTITYTGTGSSNAITGVGFQTDWLWIKRRNGATSHRVFDSTRANGLFLSTDTTNQEDDGSSLFTSFDSDGFTVQGTSNSTNASGQTYVAWNWKANGGTTSSNTDGSITSTVQANTDAGFSIVTYTGTGSNATVGHGLGAVPKMYIVKRRDADGHSWAVYNSNLGATKQLRLSGTNAEITTANIWNNTEPTSSVFSVGTNTDSNASSGTHIAYCFAEVESYSRFGKYTGNATSTPADGTFVYTSFKPLWLMVKRTDITGQWRIYDTKRSPINYMDELLSADSNASEAEGSTSRVDFLSNGFKMRGSASGTNKDGGTYIYMAFAESPFKYANAR